MKELSNAVPSQAIARCFPLGQSACRTPSCTASEQNTKVMRFKLREGVSRGRVQPPQ
jgi:hypothetical protein